MGFFLKKLLGELLMPLPVIFFLAAAGLLVRWRTERKRLGRGLLLASALLLWGASCGPLTQRGVALLEGGHPAFPGDSVVAVVVLGAGHVSDPDLPPGARLSAAALYRLAEGMRIARAQPWTQLILSGYGGGDARSNAEAYRDVALGLGFPEARLVLEARPRDTAEEARLLAPRLGEQPFALVTSATHMRRAVALFEARGLRPVPAPTAFVAPDLGGWDWRGLVPQVEALSRAERLWYEILGNVWVRLRGQV